MHSKGIIYRDIKPDNIILRQSNGKPVLIDFGAVETMTAVVNYQGKITHSMYWVLRIYVSRAGNWETDLCQRPV